MILALLGTGHIFTPVLFREDPISSLAYLKKMGKGGCGDKKSGITVNRVEGQYHLSHIFDEFQTSASTSVISMKKIN